MRKHGSPTARMRPAVCRDAPRAATRQAVAATAKSLIDRIPTDTDALFAFPVTPPPAPEADKAAPLSGRLSLLLPAALQQSSCCCFGVRAAFGSVSAAAAGHDWAGGGRCGGQVQWGVYDEKRVGEERMRPWVAKKARERGEARDESNSPPFTPQGD